MYQWCNYQFSILFLRSLRYCISNFTFQLAAIAKNPYQNQIKSSRYLQSEGRTFLPRYIGCEIVYAIYLLGIYLSMFQQGWGPNTIFSSQLPEMSQTFQSMSLTLLSSQGKSQFLPNLITLLSLGLHLQMRPSMPLLLPVQVFDQKPLSLNVPSTTTAFR